MLLWVVYPVAYSIYLSFCNYDGMTEPVFVGFTNYSGLWSDDRFWTSLWNTAIESALRPDFVDRPTLTTRVDLTISDTCLHDGSGPRPL
jgi:hypothetical protein